MSEYRTPDIDPVCILIGINVPENLIPVFFGTLSIPADVSLWEQAGTETPENCVQEVEKWQDAIYGVAFDIATSPILQDSGGDVLMLGDDDFLEQD